MIIPLEVAGLVHVNKIVAFVGCDVKFCGISPGTMDKIIIKYKYNNEKQTIHVQNLFIDICKPYDLIHYFNHLLSCAVLNLH